MSVDQTLVCAILIEALAVVFERRKLSSEYRPSYGPPMCHL